MKGGYNGVRERNGDLCPVCQRKYDRYIPADDDMTIDPDSPGRRVCISVNHAAHASGGYVHFNDLMDDDSADNIPQNRSKTTRQ